MGVITSNAARKGSYNIEAAGFLFSAPLRDVNTIHQDMD